MPNNRTELQQEIISALIDSKAVNFEAVASVVAKHGPRLAKSGDEFALVINRRAMDLCIPVDPFRVARPALADSQDA